MSSVFFNTLTSKQKKVYTAIESYLKQNGISPTVREIGELVGEKTPGAVQGILNRLEQKGVIKRQLGMARSIQLVSQDLALYATPVYIPEIKKINKRNIDDLLNFYNINKYQPVSPDIVKPENMYFLIKCPDNSLVESGIGMDDLLLVWMTGTLKDGDIVLVLYENRAFLRYYRGSSQDGITTLQADTNLIGKDVFYPDEIRIIGKLAGKYTTY